jgi:hypothetical protein
MKTIAAILEPSQLLGLLPVRVLVAWEFPAYKNRATFAPLRGSAIANVRVEIICDGRTADLRRPT